MDHKSRLPLSTPSSVNVPPPLPFSTSPDPDRLTSTTLPVSLTPDLLVFHSPPRNLHPTPMGTRFRSDARRASLSLEKHDATLPSGTQRVAVLVSGAEQGTAASQAETMCGTERRARDSEPRKEAPRIRQAHSRATTHPGFKKSKSISKAPTCFSRMPGTPSVMVGPSVSGPDGTDNMPGKRRQRMALASRPWSPRATAAVAGPMSSRRRAAAPSRSLNPPGRQKHESWALHNVAAAAPLNG